MLKGDSEGRSLGETAMKIDGDHLVTERDLCVSPSGQASRWQSQQEPRGCGCYCVRGSRTSRLSWDNTDILCFFQPSAPVSCFIKGNWAVTVASEKTEARVTGGTNNSTWPQQEVKPTTTASMVSACCGAFSVLFSIPPVTQVTSKQTQPLGRATKPPQTFTQDLAYHGKAADCLLRQVPFLVAQSLAKDLKETKSYDSGLENLVSAWIHSSDARSKISASVWAPCAHKETCCYPIPLQRSGLTPQHLTHVFVWKTYISRGDLFANLPTGRPHQWELRRTMWRLLTVHLAINLVSVCSVPDGTVTFLMC